MEPTFTHALYIGHNGLGDNITSIGAVRYISTIYDKVYIVCKNKYYENVKRMYSDIDNIIILQFNTEGLSFINGELKSVYRITLGLIHQYNPDILIAGPAFKSSIPSRIINKKLLDYKPDEDIHKYTTSYHHIKEMYTNIGLDLSIYYKYFNIPSSRNSMDMYNKIKDKKIIFCHTRSSNTEIEIPTTIKQKIHDNKYIVICANKNIYPKDHEYHSVAEEYTKLFVTDFIDIIKHSHELFVIDSCFSCIIMPLLKLGKLSTDKVTIIRR